MKVTVAALKNSTTVGGEHHTSKELEVLVSADNKGQFLKAYYMVINRRYSNITPDHVKNNKKPDQINQKFDIHGEVELGNLSTALNLTATDDQVFEEGHWIYMVTEDEYGTLIMLEPTQITREK